FAYCGEIPSQHQLIGLHANFQAESQGDAYQCGRHSGRGDTQAAPASSLSQLVFASLTVQARQIDTALRRPDTVEQAANLLQCGVRLPAGRARGQVFLQLCRLVRWQISVKESGQGILNVLAIHGVFSSDSSWTCCKRSRS